MGTSPSAVEARWHAPLSVEHGIREMARRDESKLGSLSRFIPDRPLLVRSILALAWVLSVAANGITLASTVSGLIVLIVLLELPPIFIALTLRQRLTAKALEADRLGQTVAALQRLLIDVKHGERYRCSPSAVDAWTATERLRQRGVSTIGTEPFQASTKRYVLRCGRTHGLVPGMRIAIVDKKQSTRLADVSLNADMIDEDQTYVDLSNEYGLLQHLLNHDSYELEVRVLDPPESKEGASELEQLLGILLLQLERSSTGTDGRK